eukprot:TRINITY_DN20502_c0_g1_i1.p1 TRINITY_DN20502_c0_g1~~TRINITY_DN20502_c0_g1_i1.p1  ORF type:complete len:615 (+),score=192.64 TRINITY_DN20502_c0_g1_i1:159-1847(+)
MDGAFKCFCEGADDVVIAVSDSQPAVCAADECTHCLYKQSVHAGRFLVAAENATSSLSKKACTTSCLVDGDCRAAEFKCAAGCDAATFDGVGTCRTFRRDPGTDLEAALRMGDTDTSVMLKQAAAGQCAQGSASVCPEPLQECFDTDPAAAGDWVCRCVHEPTASVTAGAVTKTCPTSAAAAEDDDDGPSAVVIVLAVLLGLCAVLAVLFFMRWKKEIKHSEAREMAHNEAQEALLASSVELNKGLAAEPAAPAGSPQEMRTLGIDVEAGSPCSMNGFGSRHALPNFPLYNLIGVGVDLYARDMELRDLPTLQDQIGAAPVEDTHVLVRGPGERDMYEGNGDMLDELCENLNFPDQVDPLQCLGCIAHHLSERYGKDADIVVLLAVCLYAAPSHILDGLLTWADGEHHNAALHTQWHYYPKTVTLLSSVALDDQGPPAAFTANMWGATPPVSGETICLPGLTEVTMGEAMDGVASLVTGTPHFIAVPGTQHAFLPPLTVLTVTQVFAPHAASEAFSSEAEAASTPFSPLLRDALSTVRPLNKRLVQAFTQAHTRAAGMSTMF